MTVITVNDVRHGVMTALHDRFPDIKVYGEEISQGFIEPCFFVKLLEATHTQALGRRYIRTHSFDVHYFAGTNADRHDMAEQLYDCLETIQAAGSACRALSMSHEIVDGVLHFFVAYTIHVMREQAGEPLMQDLEQEGDLK